MEYTTQSPNINTTIILFRIEEFRSPIVIMNSNTCMGMSRDGSNTSTSVQQIQSHPAYTHHPSQIYSLA